MRPRRILAHVYGNHPPGVSVLFRNRPVPPRGGTRPPADRAAKATGRSCPAPPVTPLEWAELPGGPGSTAITTICRERMTCGR
ncbi:hypothetical protein GCM10015535_39970 [Streptomyces gelaticus]|uniref:Uncharacterized protein n=1 Tax=Streptomyces gelaticus TaxID=285446 RepID=A0ABQ2W0Y4_9ACTN|nr:hypothetical protein GCM10015535_39970 [Streptomyces gelaticus]